MDAFLLRYFDTKKKTGHILQKNAKNRFFFNILYLEKEATVVAEIFGTL
jgi:hypothetical protein